MPARGPAGAAARQHMAGMQAMQLRAAQPPITTELYSYS
jgi:hypothetical protein